MYKTRKEIIEIIEIWRHIKYYRYQYQVSSLWRIKNVKTDSILKIWKRRQYGKIMLYKKWVWKEFAIHRLVWQAFLWLDICDTKVLCLHRKEYLDERWMLDNSLSNIFLWTHKDNTQDMLQKWRHKSAWRWKFWEEHNVTKKIYQYDSNWYFIEEWNWWYEIQRELWFIPSAINKVCNWIRKTAYWFIWSYNIKNRNDIKKWNRKVN